eukprot:gene10544-21984_t
MTTKSSQDGLDDFVECDIELDIIGMMCQKNCGTTVQNSLLAVPKVRHAEVNFSEKKARVWGTPVIIDLLEAVDMVGFEAKLRTVGDDHESNGVIEIPDCILLIGNMSDPNESPVRVKAALMGVDGVLGVNVDYRRGQAMVWGFADVPPMIYALKQAGFSGSEVNNPKGTSSSQRHSLSSSSGQKEGSMSAGMMSTVEIRVVGLRNPSNASPIESCLESIPGVKTVRVSFLSEKVEIGFVRSIVKEEELVKELETLGYDVTVQESRDAGRGPRRPYFLHISGMTCANCALSIERNIKKIQGVAEVSVSSVTGTAKVLVDEDSFLGGIRDVVDRVVSLGYGCELTESLSPDAAQDEYRELRTWTWTVGAALALGLPVMVLHLLAVGNTVVRKQLQQPLLCSGGMTLGQTVMVVLNTALQFGIGYRYYRAAFLGARHGIFGMDFLVVTGTTVIFVYNISQLCIACVCGIPSMHVFLEASGMLLMFVTLGKFIEVYAKGRSMSAITSLTKLQPRKALLVVTPISTSTSSMTLLSSSSTIATNTITTDDSQCQMEVVKEGEYKDDNNININNSNESESLSEVLREIELALVQRGDTVKVLPGSRIPTDGVIISGESYIDESLVTGESQPVFRGKGDHLFACTVNQNGLLYVRVTSLGSDSALAQIVALVQGAQLHKAPVQALADRMASVFTPVVLCLALSTFLVWLGLAYLHLVPRDWFAEEYGSPVLFALLFGISVVVVSCPCALGLATPTAILVGTSVAAASGVLIKSGIAFETAQSVNTVIFDKTGTLTEGKPSLTDAVWLANDEDNDPNINTHTDTAESGAAIGSEGSSSNSNSSRRRATLIRLAAVAEQGSDHPAARAILYAAEIANIPLENLAAEAFGNTPGSGIRCDAKDGRIAVGNRAYMLSNAVVVTAHADATMWDLEVQGKTAVGVALNGVMLGVLGVADTIKPEAEPTLAALRAMHIDVWIVTGDNRTTAEAVGDDLGVARDRIVAGAMPADKVAKVKALQAEGRVVAMVGDGINDSPALACADLGVAIGAGTQVAMEAADIVLVRNSLHDVVVVIDLAKHVFARIKWNIWWALVYNLIAVPVAAGAWFPWTHMLLPPQYAGLSMAMSSISVVLSSMSLRLYRQPTLISSSRRSSKGIIGKAMRKLGTMQNVLTESVRNTSLTGPSYKMLPVEDQGEELGLELGLGGLGGLKKSDDIDFDDNDINRLI